MIIKGLTLALAITIGAAQGCAPLAQLIGGSSVTTVAPTTIKEAKRALIIAHVTYDGLGLGLEAAANSGAIRGSVAATALCWHIKAGNAIRAADTADRALDAEGITNSISIMNEAVVQAKTTLEPCQAN